MIALVDCNNFYASCEKVFRPDLKNKPVIVLSNNDGCVVARSAEVKALGIKAGIPVFKIKDLIKQHNITIFSSNYALYGDISRRVMTILEQLSPRIEIYSIDEAFVDLDGISDVEGFAHCIRDTIQKWTGITVAVGISQTKTLAKLANHAAKKYAKTGGVVFLTPNRYEKLMAITPVDEVWGVGRRLTVQLQKMGIQTVLDLKNTDPFEIRKRFSVVLARTVEELRGISCLKLTEICNPKKQIVTSRSFGQRITTLDNMRQALSEFIEKACSRLRAERQFARVLMIFIQTSPYSHVQHYSNSIQGRLEHHTNDTLRFNRLAQQLLSRIWLDGFAYSKAGVVLLDLTETQRRQRTLFEQPEKDNSKLMEALDRINNSIGSIHLASTGIRHTWAMQRNNLSPLYTTRWDDLPRV